MQISLKDITYSYEDSPRQALVAVTATFPSGWTGIVGNNGSGKTTLLRVMCGLLKASSGTITPRVAGVYCAQETQLPPAMADDFAQDFSPEALRIRKELVIDQDWAWRYDLLSEGQRKRLQVGVALWQNPPLLALDEPTNHVDAPTRKQLLDALTHFSGIGLLVSHDREMLDVLVSQCLFLSPKNATMRLGTYTQGQSQVQLESVTIKRERRSAKDELIRLTKTKIARDNEAARADSRRSKRHLDKHDKDAKGRIDLAIYTGQDGKAGRRSAQLDGRLEKAQQRLEAAYVDKAYSYNVWLDTQPSRRKTLVELSEGSLAFGSGTSIAHGHQPCCLQVPKLQIGSCDHIALTGANGTGKTTLIRAFMRALDKTNLRVLFVPQELESEERRKLLAHIAGLPQAQRGRALGIVAQLNSDPRRILDGATISPGEARKLLLALGILSSPQIIVMDEPTNHLDLASTEALERMLASCPCALLLVSHDSRFLAKTTDTRWHIEPSEDGSALCLATHAY